MYQTAVQGGFLAAVALLFGAKTLRYPLGTLDRPGPGLFPLVVSAALLLLSAAILIGSRHPAADRLQFRWGGIGVLLLALCGFVLATRLTTMAVGIVVLVFTAGFAARKPSLRRNAVLALVLIVIALGFERLLGLRLRVF